MDPDLGPSYTLVQGIDGTKDLRVAALTELVGTHAQEKSVGGVLSHFRYTDSYNELVEALALRLPSHLDHWGNAHSKSTSGPMTHSAAMRLEQNCSFWIAADTVVVLAPIMATPMRAELLGRDGTVVAIGLEPADLVILNDTGLRVSGGHFRFIMMAWMAGPPTHPVANYPRGPVLHNLPAHGWTALRG
ncbi:hypothetical protein B0J13DRAFT_182501 [Dactylonectria estremocensis]|uniref:Uncharacterized protein n=1 Tax=Dactylonectria estremocensis TaxID=1079267 RepID=A0A9P9FBW4_9HYPO|nr:hypothetical protein B0J13DRAFT_182501 [Dactylonectria estremocensis]